MKWHNHPLFKATLAGSWIFIWLGLIGCATLRDDPAPDWWANPHKHDEWHLYFTAEGRSPISHEDARRLAQETMGLELRKMLMADMEASNLDYETAIRDTLMSPEFDSLYGNVEGMVGGTYAVWLMGRYPLRDYNRFRGRFGSEQKTGVAQQAFGGRVVGVYARMSSSGIASEDPVGTKALTQWLVKNDIQTVAVSHPLPDMCVAFDHDGARRIAKAFAGRKVDVVFATRLDLDASKTGVKVGIPASSEVADALDATLTYCIIRTSDGCILATDHTTGYSRDRANMLNVILTHPRHLPSRAADIANGLGAEK